MNENIDFDDGKISKSKKRYTKLWQKLIKSEMKKWKKWFKMTLIRIQRTIIFQICNNVNTIVYIYNELDGNKNRRHKIF